MVNCVADRETDIIVAVHFLSMNKMTLLTNIHEAP